MGFINGLCGVRFTILRKDSVIPLFESLFMLSILIFDVATTLPSTFGLKRIHLNGFHRNSMQSIVFQISE